MSNVKKMNLEECVAHITALSEQLGIAAETSFPTVGAARMHALDLEARVNAAQSGTSGPAEGGTSAPAAGEAADTGDRSKYDTRDRRGPNLGTGAYAKQRIAEGADNKTILEEIREKFPEAKTSMASIAFYRNRMKHAQAARTPESLRDKAAALREEADKLDQEAAALQAELDAAAAKQAETQPA